MELAGKTVAVLVEDFYQDLEVWYPIYRLREAGAKVITVGTGTKKSYTGKYGYPVDADTEASKVKVADIDGIIIPGGFAPDMMRRHPAVIKLVADAEKKGKVIASICHGAWILCSANILKGRMATCFFAIKDDVINAGAIYVDQEVCVDGNLITSRKPDDLPAFMRETIKCLKFKV